MTAPAPREPLSDPAPRAVAVVERDGKVLVIRRHLDGRAYAVLPGGGVEEGESPAEAALRELREECTLDGHVAELLAEDDHGGRHAWYFRVAGVEGEPVLGGDEAERQDEHDQYHPTWASPKDLELMGLLPDGLAGRVVEWLWPFRVRRAQTAADHQVVERLWQLFSHDLSEFRGTTPAADGLLARGHLDSYPADDPDAAVYLAERGDRPVGFALVRGLTADTRVLGEFFVVRSVRRTGLARAFAEHVVHAHPGRWSVAFQDENEAAARFWRRLWGDELRDVTEQGRAVPNKPYLPADRWLSGTGTR